MVLNLTSHYALLVNKAEALFRLGSASLPVRKNDVLGQSNVRDLQVPATLKRCTRESRIVLA